jgi:hypothetical protein
VAVRCLVAEIDAAGEFAHHHDVDAAQQLSFDRRGIEHRGMRHHRPQIGEQPERLAQLQQALFGRTLAFGSDHCGPPTAPSKRGIGALRQLERGRRQRLARRIDGGAAEQRRLELELMPKARLPRSSARTASAVTSPPMPSPASTAISAFIQHSPQQRACRFEALDVLELAAQVAEFVHAVDQAVARKGFDGERHRTPVGSVRRMASRSMSTAAPGCSSSQREWLSSTTMGSSPFFRELPRKMSAISVLITARSRNPAAPRAHARAMSRSRSCGPPPAPRRRALPAC